MAKNGIFHFCYGTLIFSSRANQSDTRRVGCDPFAVRCILRATATRKALSARAANPLPPPRCYTISAVGDSPSRDLEFPLCVGGCISLHLSETGLLFTCSPALSLSVSQLNNTNNSLLLLKYPVPNCGCHANAVSYPQNS